MSIPKEPRQQMINLMYLVLTALLALNVSAEILNAFKLVNQGLDTSNGIIDRSNGQLMTSFEEKANDPSEGVKAMPFFKKATEAKKITDELFAELQGHVDELLTIGGYDPETGRIKKQDDLNSGTNYMINKGNATEIKNKVNEVHDLLLDLVYDEKTLPDTVSAAVKKTMAEQRAAIDARLNAKNR